MDMENDIARLDEFILELLAYGATTHLEKI